MKKICKFLIIIVIICLVGFGVYKLFFTSKTNEEQNNNTNTNTDTSVTKYYSYEGNGKFTMSSTSNKVSNVSELNNNYYIKEKIVKEKSKEKIIGVLYNDFEREPYLYGYYNNSDFNKYFSVQINAGLVCDNKTEIAFGEGVNIKCIEHEAGYEYEKIESELCANINEKEVCIKPNDWGNIENYKTKFEDTGWICEYKDYDTGKWSESKPINGTLDCSKQKPSENKYEDNELFCSIITDGDATCNNNIGWCSINSDLNTNCFGVN